MVALESALGSDHVKYTSNRDPETLSVSNIDNDCGTIADGF